MSYRYLIISASVFCGTLLPSTLSANPQQIYNFTASDGTQVNYRESCTSTPTGAAFSGQIGAVMNNAGTSPSIMYYKIANSGMTASGDTVPFSELGSFGVGGDTMSNGFNFGSIEIGGNAATTSSCSGQSIYVWLPSDLKMASDGSQYVNWSDATERNGII